MLKNAAIYIYSDVVLTELLAAIRNFSRVTPKLNLI
jgi:hypothetical protein